MAKRKLTKEDLIEIKDYVEDVQFEQGFSSTKKQNLIKKISNFALNAKAFNRVSKFEKIGDVKYYLVFKWPVDKDYMKLTHYAIDYGVEPRTSNVVFKFLKENSKILKNLNKKLSLYLDGVENFTTKYELEHEELMVLLNYIRTK